MKPTRCRPEPTAQTSGYENLRLPRGGALPSPKALRALPTALVPIAGDSEADRASRDSNRRSSVGVRAEHAWADPHRVGGKRAGRGSIRTPINGSLAPVGLQASNVAERHSRTTEGAREGSPAVSTARNATDFLYRVRNGSIVSSPERANLATFSAKNMSLPTHRRPDVREEASYEGAAA